MERSGGGSRSTRHFSGTFARLTMSLLDRTGGPAAVDEALRLAGEQRSVSEICDDVNWSSYGQMRRLLEAAAGVLGGPEALFEAGAGSELGGSHAPEVTELYQSLDGPGTIYAALGAGHTMLSTVMSHDVEQVGPTEWLVRQRLDGFPDYEEFCHLCAGMLAMTPRLFGHANAEVIERTCRRRGDEWCTFHVRWDEGEDLARRADHFEARAKLFEHRFEALERTVADLGSGGDLATVLARIVDSAARAVRMPAFVLAIEPLPWVEERVYARGLDAAAADTVAGELLDPNREDRPELLVAEVASGSRRYGWLAAVNVDGVGLPAEIVVLRSYARLAATALDSAMVLAEVRSQEARSRTLLSLSAALAEITTTDEMAVTIARAVPDVTGADCAVVAFHAGDSGSVLVHSTFGFEPAADAVLRDAELQGRRGPSDHELRYYDLSTAPQDLEDVMAATGVAALASVPVFVEGRFSCVIVAAVKDGPERLRATPELEARLRGLAGQASTALRNARLLEQIQHQALHDALTGLPNRALVVDRAERMLERDGTGTGSAALFIDLDGFKDINDTLGHAAGDELLRAVADRLRTVVRGSDTIARLGGDEFVVLTSAPESGAQHAAARILDVLRPPFLLPGRQDMPITISASIGIAVAAAGVDAGDLLRDADVALYQAKAAGKDQAVVFTPEMQAAVRHRTMLDTELRAAVDQDELFLVFQPVLELVGRSIVGVEALLRWQHPQRGLVQPADFIPHLEQSGLIVEVGRWVLEVACRQAAAWHRAGQRLDVSVNVSARQLESDSLVDDVRRALDLAGLHPRHLVIEVTETAIMQDAEASARRLQALKSLGVRIAIDDFGTGYSSLAYLRQFPVDTLKIDRSFVSASTGSAEGTALLRMLVQLGQGLGFETVAEGIEDLDQLALLQRERCQSGQGFLFARPMSAHALDAWLLDAGELSSATA